MRRLLDIVVLSSHSRRLLHSSAARLSEEGYKYFEDQFPEHEAPPSYQYYEDQERAATTINNDPKPELSESEILKKRHNWKTLECGAVVVPDDFGWSEDWGPAPGEYGHNEWYKKPREYMSSDEKFKLDTGLQTPVKKAGFRHQKLPFQDRMEAAYSNLQEERPHYRGLKEPGRDAPFTQQEKGESMLTARNEYMNEWLTKPGVEESNLGMKIAEYNGTDKGKQAKKAPRRPEWEMTPVTNDPYA